LTWSGRGTNQRDVDECNQRFGDAGAIGFQQRASNTELPALSTATAPVRQFREKGEHA